MKVNKFRKKFNSRKAIHHSELLTDALAIYNQFIKHDAEEQLNLPSATMEKIQNKFSEPVCFSYRS